MSMTTGNEQEGAEQSPVSPYSRCVCVYDFKGDGSADLSFNEGDELTIIEPCNAMYWYLAEDKVGKRGVIPINYVEVVKRSQLDPPPLPKPLKREPLPSPAGAQQGPAGAVSILPSPPILPSPVSSPHTRSIDVPPPRPVKSSQLSIKHSPVTQAPVADSPPPLPPPNTKPAFTKKPVVSPPVSTPSPPLQTRSSIDDRPPLPLPTSSPELPRPITSNPPPRRIFVSRPLQRSKYPTIHDFLKASGWFKPTVESVLSQKMSFSLQGYRRLKYGVYFFQHKWDDNKQYVGKSLTLSDDLTRMFSCLYDKPDEKMNALELELRYHSPDAKHWNVRAWSTQTTDAADLEQTKLIIKHRTLQPSGLNEKIEFVSRAHFNSFCEWYTEHRMKSKK